ncbi:MAG: ribonuclease HII [Spirochaetaceae bacterium]|nr:ribonuclease HII [Spirochaetaceae bacterium]
MIVCGIDEAGRGPLAGPVTASAVVLPKDFPVEKLNDSKKLSEKKRLQLETEIKEKALAWAIASVEHTVIDEINILQASLLAMKNAFIEVKRQLVEKGINLDDLYVIVDGNTYPDIDCAGQWAIKGDALYPAVMAASILAKTDRDRQMVAFDKLYPEYGYAKHKGYPTKKHKEICRAIGPSPIQRKSFKY